MGVSHGRSSFVPFSHTAKPYTTVKSAAAAASDGGSHSVGARSHATIGGVPSIERRRRSASVERTKRSTRAAASGSSFVTCGAVSDTSLCSGKHTARKSALSARRSQVRRMRTNGRSSLIV